MASTQTPMGTEFGRRLRSFLEEGTWWQMLQTLKGEVSCDDLWQFVVCGIKGLAPADEQFARTVNWCITRSEIALTNVEPYGYQIWWYLLDDPEATSGKLVIQGHVAVVVRDAVPEAAVKDGAALFVKNLIRPTSYIDAKPTADPAKDTASGASMNGYTRWTIQGRLIVK